ncbi:Leucine-rich repeat-containing protein 23 [Rhizophlyctis rosea]|uniref:Leucine-rich repeat-containing protein 23 n=1 Tax=Rhizophlyctis rosea TaxID=64517 RepID=A0AAD5SCN2_9FUNG|nr:Leucine-rich repeat-containing protein 23 [Rhizophlyctis rosea]
MSDEDDTTHNDDPISDDDRPPTPPEKSGPAGAKPLTTDLVATHLSLLARTGNGLAHAYTRLELHNEGITNVDALEYYPNLRYLDLSSNALRDIGTLTSLEYLLSLDLHSNALRSIPSALDKRKFIQQANFAKNRLEVWEVTSWPMCAWLNVNDNKLSNLPLPEFHELLHLEARGNKLTNLAPIVCPKLQRLYLANNNISSLTGLENKQSLQLLHLRANKIRSLDVIGDLGALSYLNLRSNQIENPKELDKIASLQNLKAIVLMDNPIDQLPTYRLELLRRLPKLERIDKDPVSEEEKEEAEQVRPAN